jgi:hypothetical protein
MEWGKRDVGDGIRERKIRVGGFVKDIYEGSEGGE